ncbi:hypothetical protein F4225_15605 [Candidatus Poribacteria bacterium]|nr:hypothetical protein [Candidatus Poribacteria bacterium]
MNSHDPVQDDEELYRNVRGKLEDKEYSIQDGKLIIEPHTFWDPAKIPDHKNPSVDRAKLKNFDPSSALLSKANGIVSINAGDVRAIGTVKTKHENEVIAEHAVDVIPDPTCDNPAHAIIIVKPELFGSKNKQKKAFSLLQIALARLATKNGWTLEPNLQQ